MLHNSLDNLTEGRELELSRFIENKGQEDNRAYFIAHIQNRKTFFSSDRITMVEIEKKEQSVRTSMGIEREEDIRTAVALELSFTDSNLDMIPSGKNSLGGVHHYLKGKIPENWAKGVYGFEKIFYQGVWNGINLEVSNWNNNLKMNWIIEKTNMVSDIKLHWEGAESIEIDSEGNLVVTHAIGTFKDLKPYAYQEVEGERIEVDCYYIIHDIFDFGFEITGDYNTNLPLIIDPIIEYSTYLGAPAFNYSPGIAVDDENCAYVTGYTTSPDFPVTPGAFQTDFNAWSSGFVTKFSPDGESLVFSTFLGGFDGNQTFLDEIVLDSDKNIYVTGSSSSEDYPVTPTAFQNIFQGVDAGIVTKLSPDGNSLIFSTYVNGTDYTYFHGIDIDVDRNVYVCGITDSEDYPTTPNAFQNTKTSNSRCGVVTKLNATGEALVYSTFLGGSKRTLCHGIKVDPEKNACISGWTSAADFPVTPNAFQPAYNPEDSYVVFVTKLNQSGENLIYSTFLGGDLALSEIKIALTSQNYMCVSGGTTSPTFPVTPGAFQTTLVYEAAFISILNDQGDLIASTFLGSLDPANIATNRSENIAVDSAGLIYVTGITLSDTFPITPEIFPSSYSGRGDAFISVFSADLSTLMFSAYLGGNNGDHGVGLFVSPPGIVYITGQTSSYDFPVTENAFQKNFSGISDGFVTKFNLPFTFVKELRITNASLMITKLN